MMSRNIPLSTLKKVIEKSSLTSRIDTSCNGRIVTISFSEIGLRTEKTSITAVSPVQIPQKPSS